MTFGKDCIMAGTDDLRTQVCGWLQADGELDAHHMASLMPWRSIMERLDER
jgi:hypothetical protein